MRRDSPNVNGLSLFLPPSHELNETLLPMLHALNTLPLTHQPSQPVQPGQGVPHPAELPFHNPMASPKQPCSALRHRAVKGNNTLV